MIRLILLLLLATAPALAQGPPPIHPNDLNAANAQARIDEIRRSGNPADYGQMNSLDSLRLQSESMGASPLAPIAPERRDVPPRAVPSAPGTWPGYQPGYLPRQ